MVGAVSWGNWKLVTGSKYRPRTRCTRAATSPLESWVLDVSPRGQHQTPTAPISQRSGQPAKHQIIPTCSHMTAWILGSWMWRKLASMLSNAWLPAAGIGGQFGKLRISTACKGLDVAGARDDVPKRVAACRAAGGSARR